MKYVEIAEDQWANLMERQCYRALAKLGIDFYPQHAIGKYRADAFLPKHNVVVEFDDPSHNTQQRRNYDDVRDEYMARLGYFTLRIPYKTLRRDVVSAIRQALESIGVPTYVHMEQCTLTISEIVAIESRQRMYLCGYTPAVNMLFPVFRSREPSE